MSAERATGLVLRCRPLTETSLIVHWLTREHGRLATVAKGARRLKSPFRGKLDVGHQAQLAFVRSRRSDLHTLTEVALEETHPALRTDLNRLRAAAYLTRLIEQTTETETPVPELFALLDAWWRALDAAPATPAALAACELQLLDALGLRPDPARTRLAPAARETLRALLAQPLAAAGTTPISSAVARALDRFLGVFLREHLGRMPQGREAVWAAARRERISSGSTPSS